MCGFGSSQSAPTNQLSTQTTSADPRAAAMYGQAWNQAQTVAQRPFTPYSNDPNAFVAPMNSTQLSAVNNLYGMQNAGQPYYEAAPGWRMLPAIRALPGWPPPICRRISTLWPRRRWAFSASSRGSSRTNFPATLRAMASGATAGRGWSAHCSLASKTSRPQTRSATSITPATIRLLARRRRI